MKQLLNYNISKPNSRMKMNPFKIFILLIVVLLITNCASHRNSTIVGGDYNEVKNETDYFVLPYGSVSLPGKWEKTDYNKISRQQFFRNQDSISVAIAFVRIDEYPFNVDGSKKGFDFVNAFYEWDSKFFVDSHGLKRQPLVKDSVNNFMIYRIYGQIEKGKFDTYFLVGEKNGNTSNFSISITDKWTENEKIDFLRNLFIEKKEE